MPSDERDTCPHCHQAFTDSPDEFGATCPDCVEWVHAKCLDHHACPARIKAGQKALAAWNAGVRGW